jgi:hypothetical protein
MWTRRRFPQEHDMARIAGVESNQAGLMTRMLYRLVRRKMRALTGTDRVPEPIRVTAHHPRLLMALGQMEMGQAAAKSVDPALKTLASLKVATLIGCPF